MGGLVGRWSVPCILFAAFCQNVVAYEISDSLVRNLSCDGLTVDSVFDSIRSDAFSSERQIQLVNRSVRNGKGVCNGLATVQRLFFYLLRFEERSFTSEEIASILPVLRGHKNRTPLNSRDHFAYQIVDRRVFSAPMKSSIEESLTDLVDQLDANEALSHIVDGLQFRKNFFPYSVPSFVSLVFYSRERNRNLIRKIVDDLKRNRIHKLGLFRGKDGHAVLPTKVIFDSPSKVILGVYDPNYPWFSVDLVWTPDSLHYDGIGTFNQSENLTASISDDLELHAIEKILLRYYQQQCRATAAF